VAAPIDLRHYVRDIPDFPRPGILFRDLTPLLANPKAMGAAIHALADPFRGEGIVCVIGIESRGFLLGTPVALELGAGFIPIRKQGKLPADTHRENYELEYGSDVLEMHKDALCGGEKVLIVDDLIATGGTAAAAVRLARAAGAEVVGCSFLIELTALAGRKLLDVDPIHVVMTY
jgi:adenine phosphoribosyltransferase